MIEAYGFGKVRISGQEHRSDVIVHGEDVRAWWREEGHRLCDRDLAEILEAKPRVLVIGTGYMGRMRAPDEVRERLAAQGIEVIVQRTGEAVKTYNRLRDEGNDAAIAMHLTC